MVSHWSLSDSKSSEVARTFLSILADLNNAIVWMVSTRPLISKSSSPFTNLVVTVTRVPIIIGINLTFKLYSFFNSLTRSKHLSFFLLSFNFTLLSAVTAKSVSSLFFLLLFLLIITRSGHLAGIRWSVCISKSQRSLCFSFSRTDSGLYLYHLFVWSNLNFSDYYYY